MWGKSRPTRATTWGAGRRLDELTGYAGGARKSCVLASKGEHALCLVSPKLELIEAIAKAPGNRVRDVLRKISRQLADNRFQR